MNLLNEIAEGEIAAMQGLTRAVSKADRDHPSWSDRCWNLFQKWLSKKQVGFHFQIEDFRIDLYKFDKIEKPNSDRAFGFISKRASGMNLIKSVGKAKTKAKSAHRANSEVWVKL
jgi:hypothetical protein